LQMNNTKMAASYWGPSR